MSQLPKEIVDKIEEDAEKVANQIFDLYVNNRPKRGPTVVAILTTLLTDSAIHYSQIIEEKEKEIKELKLTLDAVDKRNYELCDILNSKEDEIEGLKAENEALRDDKQNIETLNEIMVNQADEISRLQSQIKILVEGITKAKSKARVFEDEEYNAHDILHDTLTNYYNSTKQPSDNG